MEVTEAIKAIESAIGRLDPIADATLIVAYQAKVDLLVQVIDDEVPTPLLCPTCNPPESLPQKCPTSGHEMLNGIAVKLPAYLPLGGPT